MKYVSLTLAYSIIALVLAVLFLFPNRPDSFVNILTITIALTLVVGVFDLIGQQLIDNASVKTMPAAARFAIYGGTLAAFLVCAYYTTIFTATSLVPW